jgi:ATP-binding cassette, subfamily C, bacterial CydD
MRPADPRLLRHARAARGYLVVAIALGVASTAMVVAQAELLARLLAGAAQGTGPAALPAALIALLAVVAVRAAAAYGGEVAALRAAATVKSQLRRSLADCLQRLGPSWLARQQPGEITTVATRGLDGLDPYFARYLPQLVLACLVPAAVLATVAAADWISAVIIAVTLPLIPVFAVLIGLHTRARTQRQWQLLARLGGHFLDVVEGLPTLKVFGRARRQADVIREVTDGYRSATMATLRVAFLSALVLELAAAVATALVAVEVGLRLLAGHLGYQTALLVLLLTPEAYLPLRAVGMHFHASMEGAAAAGRVCNIIETAPAFASRRRARRARRCARADGPATSGERCDLRYDEITLDAVSLAYPGRDRPALAEVSLTIRPGDQIAVTGPSGAGKSSLLGLLLRFTEPTGGRITAGGIDLARIDADNWRRQVTWVPQRPYLFAATVADNIALGQPDASRKDIARAASLAGADAFIEALPDGYDTPLGEQALRLSAGQRQRITLARAFLRDAPLLLLDEPTAHLDPIVAGQILAVIRTLMAGRTVILVTHRHAWQGLRRAGAGRVLTLDHGRVLPPGLHEPAGRSRPVAVLS